MPVRRVFQRWLFIAPIVLPAWLLIGWAVFGSSGWAALALVIVVPLTFIVLGVVALIVSARPTVRAQRAVSWIDVGVLGAWHACIIATGFGGATAGGFALLAGGLTIVAFWVSLWQLLDDGARRMRASMAEFERLAGQQSGTASADATSIRRPPFDDGDGDVIVVRERRD